MNLKFEFGWIWSGGMNLNDMNLNLVEFVFIKQFDRSILMIWIWDLNLNDMNLNLVEFDQMIWRYEFEWYEFEFGWICFYKTIW